MILSDTKTQALAFGIFVLCGIIFGILLWLILFIEKIFNTKLAFNAIAESVYCCLLFTCMFLIEKYIFAFDFHLYGIFTLICLIFLSNYLLAKLTKSYTEKLTSIATKLKHKIGSTKLFKFLKK